MTIQDDDNGTTNIDRLKQYEINYRKTLTDLSIIKKNIVDVESRLNEAMQEVKIIILFLQFDLFYDLFNWLLLTRSHSLCSP